MSWLKTPFADRLGIDLPILGFSHSTEVSAAITAAGGLGVYGVAHDPPEALPAKLAELEATSGDGPTAVDVMMPAGMPEGQTLEEIRAGLPEEHRAFVDDLVDRYNVPASTRKTFFNSVLRTPAYFEGQLEAVLDSDVNLVAFGVGLTKDAVDRLRDAGKTVGALIGSPHHVDRYLDVGLDFLVAQGSEAGGHTGTIGAMVLVPEVVQRAPGIPVLAAGGIAHGSQLAAALAMGAQGVWLGTAWLGTEEHRRGDHAVTDRVRQKLFAAGSGDTAITRGSSGKPQRQVRTKWIDEWASDAAPAPLKMPFQHALVGDLMTAIEEHEVDPLLNSPAGQGVTWMTETKTVAQVVEDLAAQAEQAINSLVSGT
ncbi:MAG: nitronate monooxygenase [Actinomycetia bacterium]|nr:nitronate monooxygenase [Actinomycetes bacterium]